jgi:hypothetical protein
MIGSVERAARRGSGPRKAGRHMPPPMALSGGMIAIQN